MQIHPYLLVTAFTLAACSAPASTPEQPSAAEQSEAQPTPVATQPTPVAAEAAAAPADAPQPAGEAAASATAVPKPAALPGKTPSPTTAAKTAPTEASPPAATVGSFAIAASSRASFLIDAPLEKIKGHWSKVGGTLSIDPGDLKKTRGHITIDLLSLRTTTFGSTGKDAKQGEHVLNWMEVGPDTSSSTRQRYRTARFDITTVESVQPGGMGSPARITAKGKLQLHGKTFDKTIKLEVTFDGPVGAPTTVHVKTVSPLSVSLRAHDIKPRDLAGRFLAGALDKIGQKISDRVTVSLRLTATRK